MNLRALAILIVLVGVALFAVLNWVAFTTPTVLSLGFMDVSAPLGAILLATIVLLSAMFLIYVVFQQAGVIVESRRYAKELKAHRELADTAESSRFTELRTFLDGELRKIEAQGSASTREVGARVERLEQQVQEKLAESTRTLSAYIGEIEDKLDRLLPLPRA